MLQFATMAPGCGIGGPNSIPAVSARSKMTHMVNFLRCMGMILPLSMMALGADSATGKWVLEPDARQIGTSQPTIRPDLLDLKADGATLTGSMTHQGFIGIRGATPACGSREIRSISESTSSADR